MSDVIEKLREGDVYRWSYRDTKAHESYWCCSCIAIVHHGRLRDTFWQIGASFNDGRSFGAEDLPKLELKYIGNLSELDKVPEYQADYYDDADIVDLNHSNQSTGNFYLRKGAKRSLSKMLAVAREKLEISIGDERRAAWNSARLRESIARIEAGDVDGHI